MLEWKEKGVICPAADKGAQMKLDFDGGGSRVYPQRSGTPPPPPSAREKKRPKKHSTPKKDKKMEEEAASMVEDRPEQ
jgi:hypothetical protein